MAVPDYADQRPAYIQIAADIREQIASGEYAPGSRLPSNRDLSERYRVAAETIRQALDVLRGDKLIATQSTRGTYVLREPAGPEPDPEVVRLTTGLQDVLQRLGKLEERISVLEDQRGGQP